MRISRQGMGLRLGVSRWLAGLVDIIVNSVIYTCTWLTSHWGCFLKASHYLPRMFCMFYEKSETSWNVWGWTEKNDAICVNLGLHFRKSENSWKVDISIVYLTHSLFSISFFIFCPFLLHFCFFLASYIWLYLSSLNSFPTICFEVINTTFVNPHMFVTDALHPFFCFLGSNTSSKEEFK